MAKKKEESLEEALNRSASKRHLTGRERHRYIGGTLHNLGKSKPRSGGKAKPTRASTTTPRRAPATRTVTHKPAPPPKPKRPTQQIVLTARKNTEASKSKPYDVYSIYNGKELWNGGLHYRKLSTAKHEAKIEQDAYNYGYKRGRFK